VKMLHLWLSVRSNCFDVMVVCVDPHSPVTTFISALLTKIAFWFSLIRL
jgi:hypothetical protein